MKNDIMSKINFKEDLLFAPNEILATAFEPSIVMGDTKKEVMHNDGVLSIEKKGDFEKFKFDKGQGLSTTFMTEGNKTIISFEKKQDGEYTNSLFLFERKIDRNAITKDNVKDLFKFENVVQAIVLNKKPQGTESVRNRITRNDISSQSNKFTGEIADFLRNNDSLPKELDFIQHVKNSQRKSYSNK